MLDSLDDVVIVDCIRCLWREKRRMSLYVRAPHTLNNTAFRWSLSVTLFAVNKNLVVRRRVPIHLEFHQRAPLSRTSMSRFVLCLVANMLYLNSCVSTLTQQHNKTRQTSLVSRTAQAPQDASPKTTLNYYTELAKRLRSGEGKDEGKKIQF